MSRMGPPASIQAIGHAALAANNHLDGDGVDRLAWLLTGDTGQTGQLPSCIRRQTIATQAND